MSSSVEARTSRRLLILIIVFGVLARLHRIDDPVLGYRPCDTAAMARNFYENGMDIFHPQIDWRGNSPGYVESEFPIFSYSIALLYQLLGVHDVIGRCLSIFLYVLSALMLFRLCWRLYDERVAVLAAGFYTVSTLAYFFTRIIQPDALLSLGSLAAVYYFWSWTEEERIGAWMLSAAGLAIAALIKPTSFYLGLPLLYLAHRAFGWSCLRRPSLWLYAVVVIVPPVLWFRHAYQLWLDYGNTFGVFGGWVKYRAFPPDLLLAAAAMWEILRRLVLLIATPVGFLLLLAGVVARPPRRNYLLHWWAIGFGVSVLLAAKGMKAHDYYQLPAVFLAAAWMAYGTLRLWIAPRAPGFLRPALIATCASVLVFSLWRWHIKTVTPAAELNRVAFAARVRDLTEPGALIVMVRPFRNVPDLYQHRTAQGEFIECDPVDFYQSHRIGWSLDDSLSTPEFIETLRGRGARYFATAFPEALHAKLRVALDERYTPLEVTPRWAIYRLAPRASDLH